MRIMSINIIASGEMQRFEDSGVVSFHSHPDSYGPMEEFTSCVISKEYTQFFFPAGLAFDDRIPNQEAFYNDLFYGEALPLWELYFDFDDKLPMVSIAPGNMDWLFCLSMSADSRRWQAGYDDAQNIVDFQLEEYPIKEWTVPPRLVGKFISLTNPTDFGEMYC